MRRSTGHVDSNGTYLRAVTRCRSAPSLDATLRLSISFAVVADSTYFPPRHITSFRWVCSYIKRGEQLLITFANHSTNVLYRSFSFNFYFPRPSRHRCLGLLEVFQRHTICTFSQTHKNLLSKPSISLKRYIQLMLRDQYTDV